MRMWLMALVLVGAVPATAMAGGPAQSATRDQLSTPRVFELPVATKDGYTATMTVRVFNQGVADQLERYLEARKAEYGFQQCAYCDDGGMWSDAAIYDSVTRFISIACATIGAGAQMLGYMNIYVDAANALCASFTIVTEAKEAGKEIYAAYERQTSAYNAASYWYSLIGTCGAGPVC
jgi:hypothetical protein